MYKSLDFDDVLIKPRLSSVNSREHVNLEIECDIRHINSRQTLKCIPIIAANMTTIGTIEMATALKNYNILTAIHKYHPPSLTYTEEWCSLKDKVFYTMGVDGPLIIDLDISLICLDVANGYISNFLRRIEQVRKHYPDAIIMAGNVATQEGVIAIAQEGANIVKVGTGSGLACATREKTGVGVPQLHAIMECADAADEAGVYICADGGCRTPGDIVKAYAAGADFVMLGGMLAGHTECNTADFYGMSSKKAMDSFNGGMKWYRTSEGKEMKVEYKGNVGNTIKDILGGIRSACTYLDCKNIDEIRDKAEFIRIR